MDELTQSRRDAEPIENRIGDEIIAAAVHIHRSLGCGLLESVYEIALTHELQKRGFSLETQVLIPVRYETIIIPAGFRADIIVEKRVIIELKSLESLNKAHHKQLLTYLRLTNCKLGYLLNFGAPLMKEGISRIVNGL